MSAFGSVAVTSLAAIGDGVRDPAVELRRLVGKFALLLAFVYVLALVAGVVSLVRGTSTSALGFVFLLLPAIAFAVSVQSAVELHQTSDPGRMKSLWPRCALYAAIGLGVLIAAVVIIDRMSNS